MRRRFLAISSICPSIMPGLAVFICLTLLGCQSTKRVARPPLPYTPEFKGTIEPISSSIVLRYQPFPKSDFTTKTFMEVNNDGETASVNSTFRGSLEGRGDGADVIWSFTIGSVDGVSDFNGAIKSGVSSMNIVMTERGIPKKTYLKDIDIDALEKKYKKLWKDNSQLLKDFSPVFPIYSINTGDTIFRSVGGFSQFSSIFDGLEVQMTGKALGITSYNGRRTIFVDVEYSKSDTVNEIA